MIATTMEALIAWLGAQTSVTDVVPSTRIFGMELPKSEAESMPRKALVLKAAGGPADSTYIGVTRARLDALCYGASPLEATQVQRVVHDALKNLRRVTQSNVLLHSAEQSGGPIYLRDQDAKWPMVIEIWTVLAAEYTVDN